MARPCFARGGGLCPLSDFLAFLGMNSINECVLELCLFFDVVLGIFGPSLYKSAGHLNIILKLDAVLGTSSLCLAL